MTAPTSQVPAREAATMRARVHHEYGSPDVLGMTDVPVPCPDAGQIRARIAAASINARDWHIMRGQPRLAVAHPEVEESLRRWSRFLVRQRLPVAGRARHPVPGPTPLPPRTGGRP